MLAGIGVWSPRFADWPAFRRGLDGELPDAAAAPRRPVPLLLPAAERRRVPDGVAVALAVAGDALAAAPSSIDTTALSSVFASAHGELAIVDYLCNTLAAEPSLLSPIRFHHSVHNAAAGYWGIATPSVGPSTSIAAGDDSFVAGLVEAATQVVAERRPVLLVVFDTPAVGLLVGSVANTALFGAALLLTPPAHDGPMLTIEVGVASKDRDQRASTFASLAASSPAARAIVLLEAIARGVDTTVDYPMVGGGVSIEVRRVVGSEPDRGAVRGARPD